MDCKTAKFKLISGNYMPLIGFGTFQIRGRKTIRDVLDYALGAGYRLIDTAAVYGNEQDIGIALKELLPKYKLKREDIFITSKLSPSDQGDKAIEALKNSISNLDCNYLDLYLIHWPGAFGVRSENKDNAIFRRKSWASLVEGVRQGLVRDIGVSNYTVNHLSELLSSNYGVKPAVNQVEWHPYYHQSDLKKLCSKEGILLQAYSSLGGTNNPDLISDRIVVEIAKNLNKTSVQVLLRWALQQNIGIIPKSISKRHIEDNTDLNFIISGNDMNRLNSFNKKEKYAWDPNSVS